MPSPFRRKGELRLPPHGANLSIPAIQISPRTKILNIEFSKILNEFMTATQNENRETMKAVNKNKLVNYTNQKK